MRTDFISFQKITKAIARAEIKLLHTIVIHIKCYMLSIIFHFKIKLYFSFFWDLAENFTNSKYLAREVHTLEKDKKEHAKKNHLNFVVYILQTPVLISHMD